MIKIFKKKNKQPETIKEVVALLGKKEEEINKLSERIELLEKQSFSLALLNNNNDGMTITSIYSNEEGSRVYGKTIKNGKSNYTLSVEEVQAIKEAQDGK
jgi:hypothetical protein